MSIYPLLQSRRHLVILGLLWALLSAGIVFFFTTLTGATGSQSLLLLAPPLVLELFLGLSSWHLCRSLPLERPRLTSTLAAHLLADLLLNAFWLASVFLYSRLLDQWFDNRSWSLLFNRSVFFLAATGFTLYIIFIWRSKNCVWANAWPRRSLNSAGSPQTKAVLLICR